MIKHIVNFSGGAASAMCLIRVIERFGKDLLSARLADTLAEGSELYAFAREVEAYCGITFDRLSDGRSTWDVFEQRGMWTDPKAGGCPPRAVAVVVS